MSDETTREQPEFEAHLRAMTRWEGPAPGAWRRALEAAADARTSGRDWRAWLLAHRGRALGLAAAIVIVSGVTVTALRSGRPATTAVGSVAPHASVATPSTRSAQQRRPGKEPPAIEGAARASAPSPLRQVGGSEALYDSDWNDRTITELPTLVGGVPGDDPAPRHVARKATVEMISADVRAAFARTVHLVSEARGEYVESSSLSGSGPGLHGQATLRVTAERLGEVLNQLRELGEVRSEQSGGDDVTAQVVDLEARLRNERRVEEELLELLASRQDAPLEDVLELRSHLAQVRRSIERLTAQRDHLGRLVALARVLVIIRAEPAGAKEKTDESSLGEHFTKATSEAWSSGLRFLADSLAAILRVLVGGLVWWAIALAALAVALRYRRREGLAPFTTEP